MKPDKPKIVITSGEPAGIGPDLLIKLSQIRHNFDITVIADPTLLAERAKKLSVPLRLNTVSNAAQTLPAESDPLKILPLPLNKPVKPGVPDKANADYLLKMLDMASENCLRRHFDAMVSAPIQKALINDAGINFSGHTEYIARYCGNFSPVMLLRCADLSVALVTTHLPLRDVADAITPGKIEKVLRTLINEMPRRFGLEKPKIAVCGLNPHAGEQGYLGDEERRIIQPVIKRLIGEGHHIDGPLPADTAFSLKRRQQTDVYVCMYHDQGLPVLKTLGFGKSVNITLGLPLIRTSVDHGTALDIAGSDKAKCDSLIFAIETAEKMALHQKRSEVRGNTGQTSRTK